LLKLLNKIVIIKIIKMIIFCDWSVNLKEEV